MTSALAFIFLGSLASAAETATPVDRPPETSGDGDHPFLALWQQDDHRRRSEAPYLRFAIWGDGRVLYARNPGKWGHDLLRGKITPTRVARLKTALTATGVFELKETSYLVPDAPKDCLMVDLGDKQQMLYWDERETPGYGINVAPKAQHLEFKRCWKVVNYLGLLALPDEGETVTERFQVPESWYLKTTELNQEKRPKTNLTEAQVLRIAEQTAKAEGYDVDKYNMTGCHYEFVYKDHTWTVFYELKPPTRPGGHFGVSVDDRSKKATLSRGE